jgi:large subunit ribosomal protein L6
MSRIGKEPVTIPAGVTVTINAQEVKVKGKLGEMAYVMQDGISAVVEGDKIVVTRKDDSLKAFHGLARAVINNNVIGVSDGYKKQLVIEGTGFKAALQGKVLSLSLGFASPKLFDIPEGVSVTVENDGLQVTVSGIDKALVGESAARIRSFYPAEPYKGKGIKYLGEKIRRKQGKKVA